MSDDRFELLTFFNTITYPLSIFYFVNENMMYVSFLKFSIHHLPFIIYLGTFDIADNIPP